MAGMNDRFYELEDILKAALESVDGLQGRACPVVEVNLSSGPLAVYERQTETGEDDLSGATGLLEENFEVHCLHSTYKKMRVLAASVKRQVQQLRDASGKLIIESVKVEQRIPDILESKVQLYRRTYNDKIQYQITGGNIE